MQKINGPILRRCGRTQNHKTIGLEGSSLPIIRSKDSNRDSHPVQNSLQTQNCQRLAHIILNVCSRESKSSYKASFFWLRALAQHVTYAPGGTSLQALWHLPFLILQLEMLGIVYGIFWMQSMSTTDFWLFSKKTSEGNSRAGSVKGNIWLSGKLGSRNFL